MVGGGEREWKNDGRMRMTLTRVGSDWTVGG